MEQNSKKYRISINEHWLGEVCGQLNNLGALLQDDFVNAQGEISFSAEIPMNELFKFIEYLNEITDGQGKVEIARN